MMSRRKKKPGLLVLGKQKRKPFKLKRRKGKAPLSLIGGAMSLRKAKLRIESLRKPKSIY